MKKTTINIPKDAKTATFSGGCFWCSESDFKRAAGVIEVISGYTGGDEDNPTYEDVSRGRTGHFEAVQVIYDPARISYEKLLALFWRHIDPTDDGGQFVDRGRQYRTAIFYHDAGQKRLAQQSKAELQASGRFDKPVVTEILPLNAFYAAEDYHQHYHQKNPQHYNMYRSGSGRDQFIQRFWKDGASNPADEAAARIFRKPDKTELNQKLNPMQYRVTQENATERPLDNAYWNNKKAGIYVDVVSGEPLFSSTDKFDSGSGWPSFTRPLAPEHIVARQDRSLMMVRTEVRSRYADSHLGHLFADGPPPDGLRYCINSAALRFVPQEDLEKEGYGEYSSLFGPSD